MSAAMPPTTMPRGGPPTLCRALATLPGLGVAKGQIFAVDGDGPRRNDPRRRLSNEQFMAYWDANKIDLAWGAIVDLDPAEVGRLRREGFILEYGGAR